MEKVFLELPYNEIPWCKNNKYRITNPLLCGRDCKSRPAGTVTLLLFSRRRVGDEVLGR